MVAKKQCISVVIPFYNEAGNIIPLIAEIDRELQKNFTRFNHEIIAVDDGSNDESWEEIKSAQKKYSYLRAIQTQRNYGQATSLQIGFLQAQGDYIFSLDGDGQNNPKDFSRLYEKLKEENLDLVAGWRKKRKDPLWMLVVTNSARFLRGVFIKDGVHDSGCTLRIYKKEVVKNLELWGEMHRYIIAISKLNGYKIGEIPVDHRAREIGTSKYNWKKSFKGLIDLIYIWFIRKYEGRPLHLFGFLGMLNFGLGTFMIFWAIMKRIIYSIDISDNGFFIMGIFLFQVGIILFLFGIIIDLLIRIHKNTNPRERYIIKQEI